MMISLRYIRYTYPGTCNLQSANMKSILKYCSLCVYKVDNTMTALWIQIYFYPTIYIYWLDRILLKVSLKADHVENYVYNNDINPSENNYFNLHVLLVHICTCVVQNGANWYIVFFAILNKNSTNRIKFIFFL